MKKFIVTERVPCVHIWTYEIEANSEEEALAIATEGKVEVVDSIVEDYDYDNTEFNVDEVDDNDEYEDDDEGLGVTLVIGVDGQDDKDEDKDDNDSNPLTDHMDFVIY